jgi:SAM-dependent methyltransferase
MQPAATAQDPPVPAVPGVPERLGVQQAIDFWDSRHRVRGELLSGGDLTYDHAGNEILYAVRLGRLLDVLGTWSSTAAPLRLLDAGCGKGYYTRAFARYGYLVDGIDTSTFAIEACRRDAVGGERYAVSTLDAWQPGYVYDAVVSVDVMFHLMDDGVWERSVRNLARLVRLGGLLVVADHDTEQDNVRGEYQVTRATHRYHELAAAEGLRPDGFVPYRFRGSPVGFHVFTRGA